MESVYASTMLKQDVRRGKSASFLINLLSIHAKAIFPRIFAVIKINASKSINNEFNFDNLVDSRMYL